MDRQKIRELVKEMRTPPPQKVVTKARKVAGAIAAIVAVGLCIAVEFYRGVYDMSVTAPPAKHTIVEQGQHMFSDGLAREGVKIRDERGAEYWVEKTVFDRMHQKR